MSFTGGVPMSGQTLGQTRDAVRNNFTNYNDVISLNHVAPNSAGAGKHTMAEFVEQAQAPATSADEVAIYSRQVTYPTPAINSELFLQKEGQAANQPDVQMSRLDSGVKLGTAGWTFLPGGLIFQWGSCGVVNGSFTTVYTARGGIAFSIATYQVFLVVNDPGAPTTPITSFTVNDSLNTKTQFTGTTNRPITLSYLAIGF